MFAKCTACGARIVSDAETFLGMPFCSPQCVARVQVALTDRFVPPETLEAHVQGFFTAACPECGRQGMNNDIYSATKVSGFLIVYTISSQQKLACAACGRKHRLLAALHCLFAGWWGPHAALCNLFVLPTNLIAAAFIRTPREPSQALRAFVKARLAESVAPNLLLDENSAGEGMSADPDAAGETIDVIGRRQDLGRSGRSS